MISQTLSTSRQWHTVIAFRVEQGHPSHELLTRSVRATDPSGLKHERPQSFMLVKEIGDGMGLLLGFSVDCQKSTCFESSF